MTVVGLARRRAKIDRAERSQGVGGCTAMVAACRCRGRRWPVAPVREDPEYGPGGGGCKAGAGTAFWYVLLSALVSGPLTELNSYGVENGSAAIEQRYFYVPVPLRGRVGPVDAIEFARHQKWQCCN